jgi:DnaJ-class molecular chaperone
MASDGDLEKLSATIGIDLAGLKEKYQSVKREQQQQQQQQQQTIGSSALTAEERELTEKRLDAYQICRVCNGSGLMIIVYNHISQEKNCTHCGGEGILKTLEEKVAAIVSSAEK